MGAFCTPAMLNTIFQTFVHQANENGLFFLANRMWAVKKTVAWVECQRIEYATNARSFYSTSDNQRNVLCGQQRTESVCNRNKQRHENSTITRTTAISTVFSVYRYPFSSSSRGALYGPIYRARGRRPRRLARSNRQWAARSLRGRLVSLAPI
ncbi:conserved hypothetical protein [Trichinella spiralis]|uniref:hypothetical protein n=1 Tax=Trichinella spiralis TaxID=6334 RepID=UPI0001EFE773|nr:conserved hypothetical protein [Trichinella spiralis]